MSAHIIILGFVQGVGMRRFIAKKANQLGLSGWVKNLPDSRVEVLVQGDKEKIVELSYKPEFGAREMRRVMQDTVENSIAKALLAETITKGDKIEINPDNFEVVKIQ